MVSPPPAPGEEHGDGGDEHGVGNTYRVDDDDGQGDFNEEQGDGDNVHIDML